MARGTKVSLPRADKAFSTLMKDESKAAAYRALMCSAIANRQASFDRRNRKDEKSAPDDSAD